MWLRPYYVFPDCDKKQLSLGPIQSSASNGSHLAKFLISFCQLCDIFLTTFWWLPFKLANQNVTTGVGGVLKRHVGFPTIGNSASHCPCILIGRCSEKQKDVKKLSKTLSGGYS